MDCFDQYFGPTGNTARDNRRIEWQIKIHFLSDEYGSIYSPSAEWTEYRRSLRSYGG